MIDDVLRSMAEKISAAAPPKWRRAELRGFATSGGGSGHSGLTYEPGAGDGDVDLHAELSAVHALAAPTGDHLTVELVVEAKGRFEGVVSESLERAPGGGFLYVLDRHALPAEPAAFQQGPAEATPAGDPREAVALLGAYLRERDRILGRDTYAPPPALPEARRAELAMGLPDDLSALYAHIDGDGGEGLLDRHPWFGLELLVNQSRPENRWWAAGRAWRHHLLSPLITSTGPRLAVRRASDHPGWIPFATSAGGDFLAVDLAPGPGGRPGQVIRLGTHHDDGPVYVADSVTALLRRHVAALRAGAYRIEHGELWIDVEQPAEEPRTLTITGPDAATMRGMRPGIERLTVLNAPLADFRPLRGTPTLWQLTVENVPGADLAPLRETPVELLDLAMDTINLWPLAGHAALRLLTLRTGDPVDLGPLLSCPRLYGLDLSQAAVADLGVLAELKNLLYLRLRRAQWEELWERSGHPAGLAAAGLADEPRRERAWWWSVDRSYHAPEPSLRTAVKWAADLAGRSADVRTFTGRFTRGGSASR
ncbi:SMI1/KNR4 family protein [Nonomuraea sp. NPDC050153]|uniref:SMI1/KNR4 family protein n=1 Tax=Nonomuraea sp. NPDC050153 TaxID=3364359 RepID=UPI0037A70FF6